MSKLNLSRLWYIFPPDDQELQPAQFRTKLNGYVAPLPREERYAVLDYLLIQYSAFERQLDLMRSREALSNDDHERRAQTLSDHLATLHQYRDGMDDAQSERPGQ